jgi:hypothetical protein
VGFPDHRTRRPSEDRRGDGPKGGAAAEDGPEATNPVVGDEYDVEAAGHRLSAGRAQ